MFFFYNKLSLEKCSLYVNIAEGPPLGSDYSHSKTEGFLGSSCRISTEITHSSKSSHHQRILDDRLLLLTVLSWLVEPLIELVVCRIFF